MSDSHSHHVTSLPMLLGTFAALIVLTVLTVVLADPTRFDFGKLDMVVTLGIAVAKAALVALIFMQLMYDKLFNAVVLVGSLLFVALFLGFALLDTVAYGPEVTSFVADNPPAPVTPVAEESPDAAAAETPEATEPTGPAAEAEVETGDDAEAPAESSPESAAAAETNNEATPESDEAGVDETPDAETPAAEAAESSEGDASADGETADEQSADTTDDDESDQS